MGGEGSGKRRLRQEGIGSRRFPSAGAKSCSCPGPTRERRGGVKTPPPPQPSPLPSPLAKATRRRTAAKRRPIPPPRRSRRRWWTGRTRSKAPRKAWAKGGAGRPPPPTPTPMSPRRRRRWPAAPSPPKVPPPNRPRRRRRNSGPRLSWKKAKRRKKSNPEPPPRPLAAAAAGHLSGQRRRGGGTAPAPCVWPRRSRKPRRRGCFLGPPGMRHPVPPSPASGDGHRAYGKIVAPVRPAALFPPRPSPTQAPHLGWGLGFLSPPPAACRALAKRRAQPGSAWFEEEKGVLLGLFLFVWVFGFFNLLFQALLEWCWLHPRAKSFHCFAGGIGSSRARRGLLSRRGGHGGGLGAFPSRIRISLPPGRRATLSPLLPVPPSRVFTARGFHAAGNARAARAAPEQGEEKSLREVSAWFKTEQNFTH